MIGASVLSCDMVVQCGYLSALVPAVRAGELGLTGKIVQAGDCWAGIDQGQYRVDGSWNRPGSLGLGLGGQGLGSRGIGNRRWSFPLDGGGGGGMVELLRCWSLSLKDSTLSSNWWISLFCLLNASSNRSISSVCDWTEPQMNWR